MMVSIHDFLGQLHVSYTNETSITGYFKTIAHLSDICHKDQFSKIVSGFYLNTSKIQGLARLSYFVNPKMVDSESYIIEFLRKNGISVHKIGLSPSPLVITKGYKWPQEEEKRLRVFLATYTRVGLEMMKQNLHHSRCLMATYRFQVRWASLDIRNHFNKSLEVLSPTYNSWDSRERMLFLSALAEWPLRTQVDWAHFMVNLILPYDFNTVFRDSDYSHYSNPLSISEINHIVKQVGLQIDDDWTPNALS